MEINELIIDCSCRMFMQSCKRLRIMKGADARGLGASAASSALWQHASTSRSIASPCTYIYHDLIYSISDRSGIIGRRDHRDHIHDMHRLLVTNTACT